eukprot:10165313-Alexandrium_andersonii.AAC.1
MHLALATRLCAPQPLHQAFGHCFGCPRGLATNWMGVAQVEHVTTMGATGICGSTGPCTSSPP